MALGLEGSGCGRLAGGQGWNRRADVLAPGGFAVEFQASLVDAEEVRAREADWGTQGGMVWVFRADREFAAGWIVLSGSFSSYRANLINAILTHQTRTATEAVPVARRQPPRRRK
jgi:competence CoiA-like predicted nuclease